MWSQLFSVISVILSLAIVLKKYPSSEADIKFTAITALLVWLIGDIIVSLNTPYQEFVSTLLKSLSLSLLLVLLLIFIRKEKPVIFRYPYFVVFIPLLIPIAHFMVMDTEIMRSVIHMSMQGVAISVFIFLSAGYANRIHHKLLTIVGVILLLWGFAFYWILQNYYIVYSWAWGLTNTLGMMACIYSFSDLIVVNKKSK